MNFDVFGETVYFLTKQCQDSGKDAYYLAVSYADSDNIERWQALGYGISIYWKMDEQENYQYYVQGRALSYGTTIIPLDRILEVDILSKQEIIDSYKHDNMRVSEAKEKAERLLSMRDSKE